MRSRHTAALAIAVAVAGLACDSILVPGIHELKGGTVVESRLTALDASYQIDPDIGQFRLMVLARGAPGSDTIVADVMSQYGTVVARSISVGQDTSLELNATPWISAPNGERWRVRVWQRHGLGTAYVLKLFARSSDPESADAKFSVGDIVSGRIEVDEDVDEFRVDGQAGEEWFLVGQASTPTEMFLVNAATGNVLAGVVAQQADGLDDWATGRVTLPSTGTYIARVKGALRGDYRFRVGRVSRTPEGRAPRVSIGETITEDLPLADIDEFVFAGRSGQEINVLVQNVSGLAEGTVITLWRGSMQVWGLVVESSTPLTDNGSGLLALPADDDYTVRVYAAGGRGLGVVTGQYRFQLYAIDRSPDPGTAPLTFNGQAVRGEIEWPGDIDEIPLDGIAGDLAILHMVADNVSRPALKVELTRADGTLLTEAQTTPNAGGIGANYTRRVTLPYTGKYVARVSGVSATSKLGWGSYTLDAYTVSPLPEHVPATIQPGETVTGERIDRYGDIDVFDLSATPGQEVNMFLASALPAGLMLMLDKELSFIHVLQTSNSLEAGGTGRVTLQSPPYRITVDGLLDGFIVDPLATPSYAVRVFPIDRKPESRSESYTLGDTVSGEPVYPSGDVDEYVLTVAAPTPVHVFWDASNNDPDAFVSAHLMDVNGREAWNTFAFPNDITLPAGTYRMRIINLNGGGGIATLNYRFAVVPR